MAAKSDSYFDARTNETSLTKCGYIDPSYPDVRCGGRGHLRRHHNQVDAESARVAGEEEQYEEQPQEEVVEEAGLAYPKGVTPTSRTASDRGNAGRVGTVGRGRGRGAPARGGAKGQGRSGRALVKGRGRGTVRARAAGEVAEGEGEGEAAEGEEGYPEGGEEGYEGEGHAEEEGGGAEEPSTEQAEEQVEPHRRAAVVNVRVSEDGFDEDAVRPFGGGTQQFARFRVVKEIEDVPVERVCATGQMYWEEPKAPIRLRPGYNCIVPVKVGKKTVLCNTRHRSG